MNVGEGALTIAVPLDDDDTLPGDVFPVGLETLSAGSASTSVRISVDFLLSFGRAGGQRLLFRTTECPARAVTRGIRPALGKSVLYTLGVQHPAVMTMLSHGISTTRECFGEVPLLPRPLDSGCELVR